MPHPHVLAGETKAAVTDTAPAPDPLPAVLPAKIHAILVFVKIGSLERTAGHQFILLRGDEGRRQRLVHARLEVMLGAHAHPVEQGADVNVIPALGVQHGAILRPVAPNGRHIKPRSAPQHGEMHVHDPVRGGRAQQIHLAVIAGVGHHRISERPGTEPGVFPIQLSAVITAVEHLRRHRRAAVIVGVINLADVGVRRGDDKGDNAVGHRHRAVAVIHQRDGRAGARPAARQVGDRRAGRRQPRQQADEDAGVAVDRKTVVGPKGHVHSKLGLA